MADTIDESSEALKRIKQLENQNIKFKYLLKAALELANEDSAGIATLQNESHSLKAKVEKLEKEKTQLEEELQSVLEDNGSEMIQTILRLEEENSELKRKFESVVRDIKKENLNLDELKAEDEQLKKILTALENEKAKLIEKIQKVGENSSSENVGENLKIKKRLFEIESQKFSIINCLEPSSTEVLPYVRSLEDNHKSYVNSVEEAVIKENISDLEHKNKELVKVVQKADNVEMKDKNKINEEIVTSNANLLSKVDKVRSKVEEINQDFVKILETPNELKEHKLSELEKSKLALYKQLEEYLLNSSNEISKLAGKLSDPEIKRLVNEMEVQKSVLLYSLQSVKINPQPPEKEIHLPSVPQSETNISASNLNTTYPSFENSTTASSSSSQENKREELNTSKEDHRLLEEQVNRLEQERERLMGQLRSISATSTTRLNTTEGVTLNERQLQTQSELHSTFMRESSHEVVVGQNYDDATNQLYANEDARLEQRIRELEIENLRIQGELDNILEEIRADKNEMSRLKFTGQALRERIEELEQQGGEKKDEI